MRDTPRTDKLYDQFGPVFHPAVMAYNSLCCELERENAQLREVLADILKYEAKDMTYTEEGTALIARARALLKTVADRMP